jgi:two-component system, OmpR family, phosphate regulon sensor histidine kinase PhoR
MTETGKKAILVVDDEITVCKSIRSALVQEDYDIDMALSGEEALRMEQAKKYDVMIVDLMMPGISGLDLLRSIKTTNPSVRVIMVTGYPTMKNTLQAMQIGAFDFLPKPFLPADLRSLVAKALAADDDKGQGSGRP